VSIRARSDFSLVWICIYIFMHNIWRRSIYLWMNNYGLALIN
jgi:hypothetical protein